MYAESIKAGNMWFKYVVLFLLKRVGKLTSYQQSYS